jgi:hypothetical protein
MNYITIEQRVRIVFLKYGLIFGAIYLALDIFSYYFITRFTTAPSLFVAAPIIFRLLLPILITAFFCFNGRKKIGGYWTLKQATTGVFIMFFITFLMQLIGRDVIFDKFIEPDNLLKTQTAAIKAKTANLKQRGYDQKSINKDMAEMKLDINPKANTIANNILSVFISIIFIFIFALIFGALFKNAEYVPVAQVKEANQ